MIVYYMYVCMYMYVLNTCTCTYIRMYACTTCMKRCMYGTLQVVVVFVRRLLNFVVLTLCTCMYVGCCCCCCFPAEGLLSKDCTLKLSFVPYVLLMRLLHSTPDQQVRTHSMYITTHLYSSETRLLLGHIGFFRANYNYLQCCWTNFPKTICMTDTVQRGSIRHWELDMMLT